MAISVGDSGSGGGGFSLGGILSGIFGGNYDGSSANGQDLGVQLPPEAAQQVKNQFLWLDANYPPGSKIETNYGTYTTKIPVDNPFYTGGGTGGGDTGEDPTGTDEEGNPIFSGGVDEVDLPDLNDPTDANDFWNLIGPIIFPPAPDGSGGDGEPTSPEDDSAYEQLRKVLAKIPLAKIGDFAKALPGIISKITGNQKLVDALKKLAPTLGALAGGPLLANLIGGPTDQQKALWESQQKLIDKSGTAGFSLLDQAQDELNGPADYYRKLSAGDRSAASEALAPDLAQIGASYNQAKQNTNLLPRSGGRSMLFNELPFKEAGDINNLFSSSRKDAIGKSTALGLGTGGLGSGLIGNALTGGSSLSDQLQRQRAAQLAAAGGISNTIYQGMKTIFDT